MKIGRLLLRLAVGGFFFAHGTQKLLGWFGGRGLDATAEGFEQLGLRPGRLNALAAGSAETGGGAGMALGLATPASASVLTATMLTAINRVHFKNGPWVTKGGYEYNVILIAAVIALTEVGPGPLSLDHALGRERTGSGWALAALLTGVGGAIGAHVLSEAAAEADAEAMAAPAAAPDQEPTEAQRGPAPVAA